MADEIRKVQYVYLTLKNQPGEGARVLGALKEAGVNLLALTGFPVRAGKAQLDLITDDLAGVRKVARAQKWELSETKRGFLAQGEDRVGAVAELLSKLAEAGINVTAIDAVSAGGGRYGAIFWVPPDQYAKAAKVLGAK